MSEKPEPNTENPTDNESSQAVVAHEAMQAMRDIQSFVEKLIDPTFLKFDAARLIAASMPQFDTARIVAAAMPKIEASQFNAARLIADSLPRLDTSGLIASAMPKFDVARMVADSMPRFDTSGILAAALPQFDAARMVAASMPHFDAARILATSMPKIDYSKILGALPKVETESFKRVLERLKPRNLRDHAVRFGVALGIMKDEGIPFFLVPDGETAEALTAASTATERRQILIDRASTIFLTCEEILDLCTDPDLAFAGSKLRSAIKAYDEFPDAAQALATNILDTVLRQHRNRNQIVSAKDGPAFIETLPHRDMFAALPMPKAHAQYYPVNGKPPSELFTRHGTAHAVGPEQYRRDNAVQAIMLAASALGYFQGLW